MSFVIRRALEDELSLVSSVLSEAAHWLAARGQAIWELAELAPETLAPEVRDGLYYLAFEDGEAAGVARLTLDDPQVWPQATPGEAIYVHRLAVRRRSAGATLSHALLSFAAAEAKRRGCAAVRLDCIASRPKLRAVYERFGFRYHSDHHFGPYHVARYELRV
jgi:GNAT superfamily N-acetyltransferase